MEQNYSSQNISVDLVSRYPISKRVIVKRTLPFGVALLLIFLLIFGLDFLRTGASYSSLLFSKRFFLYFAMASTCAIMLALKFLYEITSRSRYYYGIENGNLVISKGIFLKQRGSFPLSRITDVYLDRSIGDLFFGLHNLNVSTPTEHSGRFARIDGLNHRTAIALQDYLAAILERSTGYGENLEAQYLGNSSSSDPFQSAVLPNHRRSSNLNRSPSESRPAIH